MNPKPRLPPNADRFRDPVFRASFNAPLAFEILDAEGKVRGRFSVDLNRFLSAPDLFTKQGWSMRRAVPHAL